MKLKHVVIIFLLLFYILSGCGTDGQSGRFYDIKVIFFAGGASDGAFSSIVANGAKAAAEDLDFTLEIVYSEWDPEKMPVQFKEAIEKKPDGICIMGHPGSGALRGLVDEARRKGIVVTSQNVNLPELEQEFRAEGFGYVGQKLRESGEALGKMCVRKFKLQPRDKALVLGLLKRGEGARAFRTDGCINGLESGGLDVGYLEIEEAAEIDPMVSVPVLEEYISLNPGLKLILFDHGFFTSLSGELLEALGKKPGEIAAAGFDLSAGAAASIKKGYLGLVLDQQPWLQGYLPVLQICLSVKYRFSGLHIDTGSGFIDSSNLETIEALVEEGVR